MTIVAVFLPVAFTSGMAGKFFRQFGVTVAAAVLISLFEAFTFAPMLSAHFFKKVERNGKKTLSSRFQNIWFPRSMKTWATAIGPSCAGR